MLSLEIIHDGSDYWVPAFAGMTTPRAAEAKWTDATQLAIATSRSGLPTR